MRRFGIAFTVCAGALALAVPWGGCTLAPRGLERERGRLTAAGQPFEPRAAARALPELPAEPDWRALLHRAFLANGDLEAAYFEWRAALSRVGVAAAYPNTNVSLGFEYLFSAEHMKAWDRTTVNIGFDPMQNLSFPGKVLAAGRAALDDARAAGKRFEAVKFALQQRLLTAYVDYALLAEKIRIQRELIALLGLARDAAASRVRAGAQQQDLLRADVDYRLAENELRNLEADLPRLQATLNALSGRPPQAPLAPPSALPAARQVLADDARLLAMAADRNPELAALAHEVAGRRDALDLARLQYIPDLNPFLGFTGGIEQVVGAMISIPATIPRIRSAVEEARAMLRRAQAELRQARLERGASFVAALYAMRNSERQAALFREEILAATELVLANLRQSYATGAAGFAELIEGERALLEVRLMLAEAWNTREKRLAELEALAGIDFETLAPAAAAGVGEPRRQGSNSEPALGAGHARGPKSKVESSKSKVESSKLARIFAAGDDFRVHSIRSTEVPRHD